MKYLRTLLCAGAGVVFIVSGLFGQILNHPLTVDGGDLTYISRPDVPDTLRTLAIMVQFQPDEDSRTTGDGQFDLSDGEPDIINPPPHDAAYFEHHLEFAKRYYHDVSNGQLTIEYTVWDQVFTLPDVMGTYSPRTAGDFTEIGNLFEEAWQLASAEAPDIPFEDFDTFIIFHAGVGRDIDLTSIFGFDPTPLDIPSLYLGPQSLKRIFGENYEGVEVGQDDFHIMNSMILPETQNRELDLVTGFQLLELGMNGLVCAMFGSRLGLPDLFNTDTGRSGIGRFGLMDGQAIFSFMGLFPPELSAWEKYHLGWIEPVTVQPGEHTFDLHAVALREPGSILRVPINAREYYLVENRHRNPFGTGQTLTLIQNGEEVTFTVQRDRAGFNAFDISDVGGVVLDAGVYDWSLPGGYVEADDIFYDGGIIIWHIDERIIDARIDENRINADIENRGIRVVEADGSQDIGREFEFLQPGQGSEDGTQFDFWYEGNPAPIYQNRFDANTIPRSKSNTGAPSNVAIYDFSARSPVMQLNVRVGSDHVKIIEGFPYQLDSVAPETSPVPFVDGILIIDNGSLKVIAEDGTLLYTNLMGRERIRVNGTPAWIEVQDMIHILTKAEGDSLVRWRISERTPVGRYPVEKEIIPSFIEEFDEPISAGPALLSDGTALVGTEGGHIYKMDATKHLVTSVSNQRIIDFHIFEDDEWAAAAEQSIITGNDIIIDLPVPIFAATGSMSQGNNKKTIYAFGEATLLIIDLTTAEVNELPVPVRSGAEFGNPIAVDLNRDGISDVIVPKNNALHAFTKSGAVLDHFPYTAGEHSLMSAYPVAFDVNSNNITDLVISNGNDLLQFIDAKGKTAGGFPIAVGENVIGSPVLFDYQNQIALAFTTADGLLYAFNVNAVWNKDAIIWGQERYDNRRTNVQRISYVRTPISDEFLPENRAYNWPNPVYDGTTNIRYYLSEAADVSISIYEMNGDRIASFDGTGYGGMDNEVTWDASNVQSGVYLGRIEARSANQSKVVFIKIAVVR